MIKSARVLVVILILTQANWAFCAEYATQWKITSIKVCRSTNGTLSPMLDAIGTFPVYSFFIPRPVWTVNGNSVEAQPNYDRGKLVSFRLPTGAAELKSGTKNTVKFALPDQNGSKIFYFDLNKIPSGDCYELF
jgi:hypothetical protein